MLYWKVTHSFEYLHQNTKESVKFWKLNSVSLLGTAKVKDAIAIPCPLFVGPLTFPVDNQAAAWQKSLQDMTDQGGVFSFFFKGGVETWCTLVYVVTYAKIVAYSKFSELLKYLNLPEYKQ